VAVRPSVGSHSTQQLGILLQNSPVPLSLVQRLQLKFSAEVQHALQHNKPVVALESTIISHGELQGCLLTAA
jgi:hypothetical protein